MGALTWPSAQRIDANLDPGVAVQVSRRVANLRDAAHEKRPACSLAAPPSRRLPFFLPPLLDGAGGDDGEHLP